MMMFDGISVGANDYGHLPLATAAGLAATLGTLSLGRRCGLGLPAVWLGLIAFYATRLAGHLLHFGATWPTNVFSGGKAGGSGSSGGGSGGGSGSREGGGGGGPLSPAAA